MIKWKGMNVSKQITVGMLVATFILSACARAEDTATAVRAAAPAPSATAPATQPVDNSGLKREPAPVAPFRDNRFEVRTRLVKVTYLGIGAVPAPQALRSQLSLPIGIGLLVDNVDEDGPAKAAGIAKDDVLHKLDDQLLVNVEQLKVLLNLHKPGDTVNITLIHQAKSQTVTVKLVEKEVVEYEGISALFAPMLGNTALPAIPAQPVTDPLTGVRVYANTQYSRFGNRPLMAGLGHNALSTSMTDKDHSITILIDSNSKTLVAKDSKGNIVFNGPIDTDSQRALVPKEVLKKADDLLKNTLVPTTNPAAERRAR